MPSFSRLSFIRITMLALLVSGLAPCASLAASVPITKTAVPNVVPVAAQSTTALSSGVPVMASLAASAPNSCTPGATQYTIQVPAGAIELSITLTGDQSDNLLVSIGQPVTVSEGQAVADYIANSPGANQTLAIGPASTPALAPGEYFIAVGNCSTSALNFTLTASITQGAINSTPSVTGLSASLDGDTLTVTGTAQDAGGDMTEVDVIFMDGAGKVLGTTTPFQYPFGTATSVAFNVTVQGMENFLPALQISFSVLDGQGNVSPAVVASFANGDPNGPQLSSITFDGLHSLMVITGSGFKAPIQVEVNGVIVAPPLKAKIKGGSKKKGGTKLKIPGTGPNLNLQNGFNRIRVISNGQRSQLVVVSI